MSDALTRYPVLAEMRISVATSLDRRKRPVWCGRCTMTIDSISPEYEEWDQADDLTLRSVEWTAIRHMQEKHGTVGT